MGILTTTDEFTSTVAAPRLFKALILEADTLIPKIAPQAIQNVDILEGNGGPGTIKLINFAQGSEFKSMKHKIEALDEKNLSFSYSLIEGDPLLEKLEKISYEISFESAPDGGAKGKNVSTYYAKPDAEVTEEEVKEGREKSALLFKAVEAYLLANPDVYA